MTVKELFDVLEEHFTVLARETEDCSALDPVWSYSDEDTVPSKLNDYLDCKVEYVEQIGDEIDPVVNASYPVYRITIK